MGIWIDWLDFIPVVGTVKNTVEAITALCHGDTALAAEKGASALVGGILDVCTAGVGHFAGTVVVKGAAKGVATVVAKKAASSAAVAGAAAVVNANLRATARDIAHEQNRRREPDDSPRPQPKDEKKRPKRGEHVINNNVLRVFRDIMDEFVDDRRGRGLPCRSTADLVPGSGPYLAYHSPLSRQHKTAVEQRMVAHIPVDVHYVDANSEMYGMAIFHLRNAVRTYMSAIADRRSYTLANIERTIRETVRLMNAGQLYVDEMAKDYWIREAGGSIALFEEVRGSVAQMFERLVYHRGNDEVIQWVRALVPGN